MKNRLTGIEAALFLNGGEKGYKKLFTRIWHYYYPRLYVYIKNIRLSDPEDDIIQEILIKVWTHLSSYNPLYSLSTWIYTIARNHLKDVYRKKQVHCISLDDPDLNPLIDTKILSPEETYFKRQKKEHISCFISRLNEKDREITYLRFYEQLKLKNIAGIMKIPVGTIKYRIYSIKQKLSVFWEDVYEKESN